MTTSPDADATVRRCDTTVNYKVYDKVKGWAVTSAESRWVVGPGSITKPETETSSHTFGSSASATFSAGAVIAKAETTFGVNHSYSTSKTDGWDYDVTIPSGQTARGLVLHRADRSGVDKQIFSPTTCKYVRTDRGSAWYPIAARNNSSYCIARDKWPAASGWKRYCTVI